MMKSPLSRRTLLRGFGVGIGLPLLEAMLPSWARPAYASPSTPPPRRFVGIFALPTGTLAKVDPAQGCMVAPWTPAAEGTLVSNPYLKHFFDANVGNKITVLTGLSDRQGAGNHHWGFGGFLTSTAPRFNRLTGHVDVLDAFGPSADQIIAQYSRQFTAIPSLVLNPTANSLDGFTSYDTCLSWKSGKEPMSNEQNPIAVFNRLFGSGSSIADAAAAKKREAYRKSVLDFVKSDAQSLKASLGNSDRAKLDQYLDGVRDLELRIQSSGAPSLCKPKFTPQGQPADLATNNAKVEIRLKLMMDILLMAFECDRTRVATLAYTNAYGLFGNAYPHLGIHHQHHHFSHWQAFEVNKVLRPDLAKSFIEKYTHWALTMYAYLLGGMDKIVDVDGSTALDNSLLYFSGEDCDSHSHSNQSMPVILGGRGGKTASGKWAVNAGRHVRFQKWVDTYTYAASGPRWLPLEPWMDQVIVETDPKTGKQVTKRVKWDWPTALRPGEKSVRDLLWTMINLCGVPDVKSFGDATGPLNLG